MDFYGFYTGRIFDAHEYLGAHPGPGGTTFRVFAPSARAVELLGLHDDVSLARALSADPRAVISSIRRAEDALDPERAPRKRHDDATSLTLHLRAPTTGDRASRTNRPSGAPGRTVHARWERGAYVEGDRSAVHPAGRRRRVREGPYDRVS